MGLVMANDHECFERRADIARLRRTQQQDSSRGTRRRSFFFRRVGHSVLLLIGDHIGFCAGSAPPPDRPLPLNKWIENEMFSPHPPREDIFLFSREHSDKRPLLLAFAPFLARPREEFANPAWAARREAVIGKSLMIGPL